jgi:hypothetical protein
MKFVINANQFTDNGILEWDISKHPNTATVIHKDTGQVKNISNYLDSEIILHPNYELYKIPELDICFIYNSIEFCKFSIPIPGLTLSKYLLIIHENFNKLNYSNCEYTVKLLLRAHKIPAIQYLLQSTNPYFFINTNDFSNDKILKWDIYNHPDTAQVIDKMTGVIDNISKYNSSLVFTNNIKEKYTYFDIVFVSKLQNKKFTIPIADLTLQKYLTILHEYYIKCTIDEKPILYNIFVNLVLIKSIVINDKPDCILKYCINNNQFTDGTILDIDLRSNFKINDFIKYHYAVVVIDDCELDSEKELDICFVYNCITTNFTIPLAKLTFLKYILCLREYYVKLLYNNQDIFYTQTIVKDRKINILFSKSSKYIIDSNKFSNDGVLKWNLSDPPLSAKVIIHKDCDQIEDVEKYFNSVVEFSNNNIEDISISFEYDSQEKWFKIPIYKLTLEKYLTFLYKCYRECNYDKPVKYKVNGREIRLQ